MVGVGSASLPNCSVASLTRASSSLRARLPRSRTTPSSERRSNVTGTCPTGSAHHRTRVQRSVCHTHHCHTPLLYICPAPSQSILESGPVPYASYDSVTFVAEQVSHHPPGEPHTLTLSLSPTTLPVSPTPSHPHSFPPPSL